jgi:hypothetical protein
MKSILALVLLTMAWSACGASNHSGAPTTAVSEAKAGQPASLTEDEKHRLYATALIATDSQLHTELFQKVCQQIGIMNSDGIPNENYTRFVSEEHWQWLSKPEAAEFKQEINTRAKANEYLKQHLPR